MPLKVLKGIDCEWLSLNIGTSKSLVQLPAWGTQSAVLYAVLPKVISIITTCSISLQMRKFIGQYLCVVGRGGEGLEVKPRASCMPGKHSTNELHCTNSRCYSYGWSKWSLRSSAFPCNLPTFFLWDNKILSPSRSTRMPLWRIKALTEGAKTYSLPLLSSLLLRHVFLYIYTLLYKRVKLKIPVV